MLQPLSPTVLPRFISARLFCVPQVENEVKRTTFCGCCWDPRSRKWWIKEVPKRGIFGSFSETVRRRKSLYICQCCLFLIRKRYVSSSRVFDLKKNISPKIFGPHCAFLFHKRFVRHWLGERLLLSEEVWATWLQCGRILSNIPDWQI